MRSKNNELLTTGLPNANFNFYIVRLFHFLSHRLLSLKYFDAFIELKQKNNNKVNKEKRKEGGITSVHATQYKKQLRPRTHDLCQSMAPLAPKHTIAQSLLMWYEDKISTQKPQFIFKRKKKKKSNYVLHRSKI